MGYRETISLKCRFRTGFQSMRLVKGNKEFMQWWNHWMSRIQITPARANNKTSSSREDVRPPAELPTTISDGKLNPSKSSLRRRTPLET